MTLSPKPSSVPRLTVMLIHDGKTVSKTHRPAEDQSSPAIEELNVDASILRMWSLSKP